MKRTLSLILAIASCLTATAQTLTVDAEKELCRIEPLIYGAGAEDVNHEIYGGLYDQKIFGEGFEEPVPKVVDSRLKISGMWSALGEGVFEHDSIVPFTGKYSQKISGKAGTGIYNLGLNRWGIAVKKGTQMKVSVYLKGTAQNVYVSLQSSDGSKEYARTKISGIGNEWKRFDVTLNPKGTDETGRFALSLAEDGTVWVDQVLLCTDSYPFRADLTEAFRQQHLSFLRYGGCMVNTSEYLTKNMIGSRLERQPYYGFWYHQATNGFAIPEFVQFARLIGAEPTFAINIEDNPKDVLAMLHEIEAYNLKYIEIGNEECISAPNRSDYEHYVERYLILYEAIHRVYPKLQFIHSAWWRYKEPELMEYVFRQLDGKCDYWDYHPWTETPQQAKVAEKEMKLMNKLFHEWNPQTTMRVAILEENGNTHDMARALAHAVMLNAVRRSGGFAAMDSPANALQPYRQNDNGWDQGQIFFSPSQVWMQPPFYAQQMAATNHQPILVESLCDTEDLLDYTATRNEAGDMVVLHIVNYDTEAHQLSLEMKNFGKVKDIRSYTLFGPEKNENTPIEPTRYSPIPGAVTDGKTLQLKPYSYTVFVITKGK